MEPATYYQRDWVLACRDGRSHFTTPLAWNLDGELNTDVLRTALRTLTARHESLRTAFQVDGTDVRQVVVPSIEPELSILDVVSEGEVEARIVLETERPRHVSVAPLWHGLLCRLGRHRHVLALFVHHLVFDGWSHGVLHDELVRCYRALVAGRAPRLPHLSVTPGDFAQWERGRRDSSVEQWWRTELAALPPILPAPPVGGRFVSVPVPPVPAEVAPESSSALLAAVCAARGGDDLVVGVTRSGRERPRLQRVLGPVLDHVPVRVDPTGGLEQVHRSYRAAVAHQLPLGRIRAVLDQDLAPRGGRLYDTRFNYLPRAAARSGDAGPLTIMPRAIPATSISPRHTEDHPEVLPLSYVLRQDPDGRLAGEICGPDSMFSSDQLHSFAADLVDVLHGARMATR